MRDPGKRPQIWNYPINQQDEIRRAYIKFGPYQFIMDEYPLSGLESHPRRFKAHWFKSFSWLEYSPEVDAAFCLPCYLFSRKSSPFTSGGFRNWKKVNNGKDCAFLSHVGKSLNSPHNIAVKSCKDLLNQLCHIDKVLAKQSSQQVLSNRLRLKASIDTVKWLTFQACAFRGHDESHESQNRGNFLEMLKLLASYNKEVDAVVLDNAPQNAIYTSPSIQKEILHVFARKVQNEIRNEIGNAKFCLIVDEARDESRREQMAPVVRFVDKHGFVKERLIDVVHVKDTTSATLKQEICSALSHHNLNIQNVRGQGYDGASNMRGEWKGLQALIIQECPYAYYVHCFAHQLQLALVAAAKEVVDVHAFFQSLSNIINVVCSSCKRNDELRSAYATEISHLVATKQIETGRGANQIGTLKRSGDTRWSSHFNSICSLLRMFGATTSVLEDLATNGSTYSQRGDATYALKSLLSFDFVFILHMMKEIMGITDKLCQALQQKSQDILNAMHLVSSTKSLIQQLRDSSWGALLEKVSSFCNDHAIQIPDIGASFSDIIRSRRKKDVVTVEHHYRVDIFTSVIDFQLKELNSRFSEQATELLILSTSLDPKDAFKLFSKQRVRELKRETHRERAMQDEGGEGDAFPRHCISLPLPKLPSPPLTPIRAERKKKNDEGERLMERRVTAVYYAANSESAQDRHHHLYHSELGRKGAASPVDAAILVEIVAIFNVVKV
nr:zinc finger MYM-type protein 1-like [Arachis hypogaea]